MKKDLISVIVPCFNVERFLDDCFASLENQTYKNFEVIFVNDGSTDDTLQKLQAFCNGKENCKLINQKNRGLSGARNSGLAVAEGEFVCFFDPDDILSNTYLEILHKTITENNCDCAVGNIQVVKEKFHHKDISTSKIKKYKTVFFNQEEILCEIFNATKISSSVWNKIYKHSLLQKMKAYPETFDVETKYGEDAPFNFKYFTLVNKVCFCSEKIYYYRQRNGSLMRSKFNESKLTFFDGIDQCIELAIEKKLAVPEKYARAFKASVAMDLLFMMQKSGKKDFHNSQAVKRAILILKENKKYFKQCKNQPAYRKLFGGLALWFFQTYFHKFLK